MNIIFLIACFFLPFENFFFAPSSGWAAISPIIMFVYVLFNINHAVNSIFRYRKIVILVCIGLIVSIIHCIFLDVYIMNFVNSLISLGLGMVELVSFDIYLCRKKGTLHSIEKVLIPAYYLSLLVGWLQFFVIKSHSSIGYQVFRMLEKRSYTQGDRIQFTFTEPSFIGMHLFGILLLVYLITRNKKMMRLIILYAFSAVFFGSGVRVLLDIIVVTFIMMLSKMNFKKVKNIIIAVMIPVVLITGVSIAYNNNARVRQIMHSGVYADGSLASRYFRINATVKGYGKDVAHFIFGYGLGNELIPLRKGYTEAKQEYRSSYLSEVNSLGNENYQEDSVSYCLFTRMISEFGVIWFVIFLAGLFVLNKKQNRINKYYIWVLLYLYLQFESYAFYTLWFFLVLINKENKEQEVLFLEQD